MFRKNLPNGVPHWSNRLILPKPIVNRRLIRFQKQRNALRKLISTIVPHNLRFRKSVKPVLRWRRKQQRQKNGWKKSDNILKTRFIVRRKMHSLLPILIQRKSFPKAKRLKQNSSAIAAKEKVLEGLICGQRKRLKKSKHKLTIFRRSVMIYLKPLTNCATVLVN